MEEYSQISQPDEALPAGKFVADAYEFQRVSVRSDSPDPVAQLQRLQLELAALKEALTVSEQETKIACQKIESLAECEMLLMRENSFLAQRSQSLRSELVRLAKKQSSGHQLSNHDGITGLPNRRLLLDRFKQAMAQATRHNKRVAMMFLHVDGFDEITFNLGHGIGEKLLKALAQRLQACLRAGDTACRCDGDEFIVMLPDIDDQKIVAAVEQKIRSQCAAKYMVDGQTITVALNTSSAIYPVDRKTGQHKSSAEKSRPAGLERADPG